MISFALPFTFLSSFLFSHLLPISYPLPLPLPCSIFFFLVVSIPFPLLSPLPYSSSSFLLSLSSFADDCRQHTQDPSYSVHTYRTDDFYSTNKAAQHYDTIECRYTAHTHNTCQTIYCVWLKMAIILFSCSDVFIVYNVLTDIRKFSKK